MNGQPPQPTRMFAEAGEAPGVVARQFVGNGPLIRELGARLRAEPPRGALTIARGSSDHAATFAKYLIETQARILTASAAPSVTSVYAAPPDVRGMLAIPISQSGKSPDIVAATAAARAAGALTIALVNNVPSPLSEACDHVLPLHAGPEQSVAATKSYIASLAALLQLIAEWRGDESLKSALDDLPALLETAWQCDWSPLVEGLADATGLYVIGRGPGFGAAQEAALKFKETCGLHAEAFSAAELRHGPMALVGRGFPLLVFRQSDESGEGTDELVREVAARGAKVFLASRSASGAIELPCPQAHPLLEPLLQVQAFYRAVNALSVQRGFDPDRPPHLSKVTETL